MRKAAPAPAAETSPFPNAAKEYHAALAVYATLKKQDEDLRDEELARMARGESPEPEEAQNLQASRAEAEALLRGEKPAPSRRKRPYLDLLRMRAAVRLAMELQQERTEQLRLKAAGERCAECRDELVAVGREMVEAVIALDRVLRKRDALIHKIGLPATTLPHEGWPLAGRLSNTASQVYRLAEVGVQNGWLTQRELDQEFEAARAADWWR